MTQRNQFSLKGCLCKSIYYIPQNYAIPQAIPHAIPQTRPLTLTRCIWGDLPNQYRSLCRYELFRCVVHLTDETEDDFASSFHIENVNKA